MTMHSPPSAPFEPVFTSEEKATLRGERFVNREFVGVDLSGADLRDARFERTIFERCNLEGADLRSARFVLCELRDVILVDALLEDSRFDGTTLVDALGLTNASRVLIEQGGGTFLHAHASLR